MTSYRGKSLSKGFKKRRFLLSVSTRTKGIVGQKKESHLQSKEHLKQIMEDFPGGPVVRNPPANAGAMGLIPDPGRSHMPWAK